MSTFQSLGGLSSSKIYHSLGNKGLIEQGTRYTYTAMKTTRKTGVFSISYDKSTPITHQPVETVTVKCKQDRFFLNAI